MLAEQPAVTIVNGLDGTVATLLICALLFIDEAGVPLPFAPNEVLLIVAGLLMGNGTIAPVVFLPLAYLCLVGGMLTGYSWARAIGSDRLRGVAVRFGAARTYDRASSRLRSARPPSIAITRMLPGVRTYATLVAGAVGVELRSFCTGALPALGTWLVLFTLLGAAVGLPAEHFLSQFANLAVTGVVLVGSSAGAIVAIRRIPPRDPDTLILVSAPTWERVALALSLDFGIVAALVIGVDRLVRSALRSTRFNGPIEFLVLVAAVVVAYVFVTRRGPGETAGESLFDVSYLSVGAHGHRD